MVGLDLLSLLSYFKYLVISTFAKPHFYKWYGLLVASFLGTSAALLFIFNSRVWYSALVKPGFAIPVFFLPLIHFFSLLLAGLGVMVVVGNISGNPAVLPARKSFGLWLVLHGVWVVLFAGLHLPVLSLAVALVAWGVSVFSIQQFFNVDPKAGRYLICFFLLTFYWAIFNIWILGLNEI